MTLSLSYCVCVCGRESFRDEGISLHHFQSACWPVMGREWERRGTFPDKELSQCKDSCHPAWLPVNDFPPHLCVYLPSHLVVLLTPSSLCFFPSPFPPSSHSFVAGKMWCDKFDASRDLIDFPFLYCSPANAEVRLSALSASYRPHCNYL